MSKILQNSNRGAGQSNRSPESVPSEAHKQILPKPGVRRRPLKPDRVERLPDGWYETFIDALKCSEHGQRLLRSFMPPCNFRLVGKAGILHLHNPRCLARARKEHKIVLTASLRKRARQLSSEIAALPGVITELTDLDSFVKSVQFGDLVTRHQKNEELEQIKAALARIPRAFRTKSSGVYENYEYLFLIREYLVHKSGTVPTSNELAAIIRAALAALGGRQKCHPIDPDTLSRNLRNFEHNRPEFCEIAKGPAAVEVVESLPSNPPQGF